MTEDRLDSWKEIAAYLRRGIKTLQRWEREEGFPVHRRRPAGEGNPTKSPRQVFAYRAEIDAWWEAFRSRESRPGHWRGRVASVGWRGAVVVLLAVGLGVAGLVLVTRSDFGTPRSAQRSEEQITAFRFASGRFSPDGRWFAFRDSEDAHLRMLDLSTLEERVLVPEWVHASFAWSRDGGRIAFVRLGESAVRLEIVELDSNARRVVQQAPALSALPQPFDWTPDGRQLLCLSPGPAPQRLGLLALESGRFTPMASTRVPGPNESVRLSSDGRFALFAARGDRDLDIFLVPVENDGPEIRVTTNPQRETNPFWSADGQQIFFVRWKTDADKSLWSVRLEPGTHRLRDEVVVTSLGSAAWRVDPVITPSGDLLVVRRPDDGAERVFLLAVDPSSGAPLGMPTSTFPQRTAAAYWSRTGDKLYYRAYAAVPSMTTNSRVYGERDLQTHSDRLVFEEPPPGVTPASTYLAVASPDEQRRAWVEQSGSILYWSDKQTSVAGHVDLGDDSIGTDFLAWSPDGREIAVGTQSFGRHELTVVRLADRQVRRLAAARLPPQVAWSPDGVTLAFTDANCLMTVAATGGVARQVTCAPPSRLPGSGSFNGGLADYLWFNLIYPSWSPDGKRIAWTVPVPAQRRVELWTVDYASGTPTLAWAGEPDYATMPRGPLWSPDGRHIAFTMTSYQKDQLWVYRNLERQ